jgi:hypothetical protein
MANDEPIAFLRQKPYNCSAHLSKPHFNSSLWFLLCWKMAIANRVMHILGATLIALLPIASAGDRLVGRDSILAAVAEGVDLPEPIKYGGSSAKSGPVLNGRSLIESWLRPRGLVCNDPGWAVCPCKSP